MKINKNEINRRQILTYTGAALGLLQLGAGNFLSLGEFTDRAMAQTTETRRFVHIMLGGAWDSAYATDPVIGDKLKSGAYESSYAPQSARTVPSKDSLIVGPGLFPALSAFSAMPTAFVNGMFVDVTAHDLARNFAFTGRMSLSRSREYPCLAALMGKTSINFPAHVALGGFVPLGDTGQTGTALASNDIVGIRGMTSEPGKSLGLNAPVMADARSLITELNGLQTSSASPARRAFFESWVAAQIKTPALYAKNLDQSLSSDPAREQLYGAKTTRDNPALLLGAFQLLRTGLSPFHTIVLNGFDTHTEDQKPILEEFAIALQAFVDDLRKTSDPTRLELTLADTTTVLITSDFVRTPKYNNTKGTNHWKSGSAIVMGKGVRDNRVFGKTDDNANALGWVGGAPVPRQDQTALLYSHLASSMLANFGFADAQSTIGTGVIDGLFI